MRFAGVSRADVTEGLARTLVAAHADCVQELARLYGLLERAATTSRSGAAHFAIELN